MKRVCSAEREETEVADVQHCHHKMPPVELFKRTSGHFCVNYPHCINLLEVVHVHVCMLNSAGLYAEVNSSKS